jgi:ABC-type dipeptide/oligopeptide/nickel transport system ATPase component
MMNNDEGFDQRYESENFDMKLERQHFGKKDTDIKAKTYISFKGNKKSSYFTELTFKPRVISKQAKAACKAQGVKPDIYAEEIENFLLEKKAEVAEVARKRKEYIKKHEKDEENSTMINDVMKRIYEADHPKVEDFADIKHFNNLIEANSDLILRNGDKLLLTNKGKRQVENLLDITKIEDIDEEADKILEEGFLDYFIDAIGEVHKGDEALKIWELVSALSAKCSERQIHSWAVGPSGKGKSHIKRAIVEFLPDEAYEAPNSMTPKSMLYKTDKEGPDCFKGKLLFLDEADGYDSDDAVVLLRGLTDPDEDEYIHEMVKDQEYDNLIIEKPITVWFTSVDSINDEQLKNRFILTNPDGSDELDNTVFEHQQWNLHRGKDPSAPPAEARVVRKALGKIRKNTAGLTPIVPFKVEWKQKFNRRLYPHFVTLMEVIAKINYKNRMIRDNYIYVSRADFQLAAKIWSALIDTTIAQTDTEALKLIMTLPDNEMEAANTSELGERLDNFNTDKVRRKADELRDTEELQLINAKKESGQWLYWAGADKDRLLNPEPEIKAEPEVMKDILENTEKGIDEAIINSVVDPEVEVYERVKEIEDKKKQEKLDEVNDWTVDVSDDEKAMLKLMEDFNFSTDLNFVAKSAKADEQEAWDIINELEDSGLIRVVDEDGEQMPQKTSSYKEAREEGKLTL